MLDELRSFILFAEEGSIQAAARRLPLTQPAVSRQIQRLEQMVGAALLDRRQKPPALTRAGMDVLARAREILAGVEEIKALGETAQPAGTFRLGLVNGLHHPLLSRAVAAVATQFPGVSVLLKSGWSGELAEQLRLGQLDAAILLGDGSRLHDVRKLGDEKLAIIRAAEPSYNQGKSCEERWILSPPPCAARQALAAKLARKGRPLIVAAEVEDPILQAGLVREGLGLGLMPRRLLTGDTPTGIIAARDPADDLCLDLLSLRSPHLGPLAKVADVIDVRLGALVGSDE